MSLIQEIVQLAEEAGIELPTKTCICPNCGYEMETPMGIPCSNYDCPKCGTPMTRKIGEGYSQSVRDKFIEWVKKYFSNPNGYYSLTNYVLDILSKCKDEVDSLLDDFGTSEKEWEDNWKEIADALMNYEFDPYSDQWTDCVHKLAKKYGYSESKNESKTVKAKLVFNGSEEPTFSLIDEQGNEIFKGIGKVDTIAKLLQLNSNPTAEDAVVCAMEKGECEVEVELEKEG